MPVAQQLQTCLIGTTTPAGSDNIVSHMITQCDGDGNPIIHSVRIGKPCAECAAAKKLCIHEESATADGTSRKKRDRFQYLYTGGREHIAMREYQGEIGDENRQLYEPDDLNSWKERSLIEVDGKVDLLFMTCDPAIGGKCEFSVVVSYFDVVRGAMVIVNLSSQVMSTGRDSELRCMFKEIILKTRGSHREFELAPFVIACEAAPSNFGPMIAEYMEELSQEIPSLSVTVMHEVDRGHRYGVGKTNSNTLDMSEMSSRFVSTGAVYFSKYCSTASPGSAVEDQKAKFFTHISRMKRRVIRRPSGDPLIRIDGKEGGANDDYGVAFMMQPYWLRVFWRQTEKYQKAKSYSAVWRSGLSLNTRYQVRAQRGQLISAEEERQKFLEARRKKNKFSIEEMYFAAAETTLPPKQQRQQQAVEETFLHDSYNEHGSSYAAPLLGTKRRSSTEERCLCAAEDEHSCEQQQQHKSRRLV